MILLYTGYSSRCLLSKPDCISIALMAERRIHRALAYDHHFEQAGFEALLRKNLPTA